MIAKIKSKKWPLIFVDKFTESKKEKEDEINRKMFSRRP